MHIRVATGRQPAPPRRRWPPVALAGLFLAYVLLFTSLEFVAGNTRLYRVTLESPEVERLTGLARAERGEALTRIVRYALGRGSDLQFVMPPGSVRPGQPAFSEDETRHMEDVRALFALGRTLRIVGLVPAVLLAGSAAAGPGVRKRLSSGGPRRRHTLAVLAGLCRWTAAWTAAFLLIVGAAALVSFRSAFDALHVVLFANDLWMLPPDALLIQLFPEEQFARLAGYAGAVMLACAGAALALGAWAAKSERSL